MAMLQGEVEFGEKSGKECMETIYKVLERETENHVPMKLRRIGQKPIWMNKNIIRLIRKKKRLWRWYTEDGGTTMPALKHTEMSKRRSRK